MVEGERVPTTTTAAICCYSGCSCQVQLPKALIDQTDETQVPVRTPATMKALSEIYIKKEGGEPDAEEHPTADPISCVDQLLQHDLPPTPHNAIFGPYGAAVHRQLKFKGQVFVNGELVTSEISGPPNCFV